MLLIDKKYSHSRHSSKKIQSKIVQDEEIQFEESPLKENKQPQQNNKKKQNQSIQKVLKSVKKDVQNQDRIYPQKQQLISQPKNQFKIDENNIQLDFQQHKRHQSSKTFSDFSELSDDDIKINKVPISQIKEKMMPSNKPYIDNSLKPADFTFQNSVVTPDSHNRFNNNNFFSIDEEKEMFQQTIEINQDKKQQQPRTNRIDELYNLSQQQQKRRQQKSLHQEKQELKQCPFQPNNNKKQEKINFNQILESQNEFMNKKQQNIQILKEQEEKKQQQIAPLKPQINDVSEKILDLNHYCDVPAYERLYNQKKKKVVKKEEVYSFKPQINQQSKQIQPKYMQQKQTKQEIQEQIQTKIKNSNSDKIIYEIFKKDFNEQVTKQELNFDDFCQALCNLKFTEDMNHQNEIWDLIQKNSFAQKESLFNILVAIQNIEIQQVNENSSFDKNNVLHIGKSDQQYMFKHFNQLNKQRLQHLHKQKTQQTQQSIQIKKTVNPQDQMDYINNMISHYEDQKQKHQKMQQQKEDIIIQQHTFQPQINENYQKSDNIPRYISLYCKNKPKILQKDKNMNEIDFDKNFKECTFQPDLSKPKISLTQNFINDFDKNIDRVRQGNEQREIMNYWKEGRGYQVPKKQNSNQDSQNKSDRNPILKIDIDLGNDQTQRITVFQGDSSKKIAQEFGQMHNLNEKQIQQLQVLVENQINSLLNQINEEEEEKQSQYS